jgi:biopolymer transport protein ExbD
MRLGFRILLVATVVLIIGLRISNRLVSRSVGLYVQLPTNESRTDCGDSSVIVLRLSKDNSFRINSEPVASRKVLGRLIDVYSARSERLLFLKPDLDVSFQEVVGAIGVAQENVRNLYVVLITTEKEKAACLSINKPRQPPKLPGL